MADRNLSKYYRGGRFSTREGMIVEIPPSGFDWGGHVPAVIDPYSESSVQLLPLGTKLIYGDRIFRYAKMGGTAGVAGNLYQSVVPLAGHLNEVIGTHAVGDTAINFTPNTVTTDDMAANEFQDGYFLAYDGTGVGIGYKIKSHPAITGGVLGVLTLMDPLVIALAAADVGSIIHNPYRAVIIHPSPQTAPVVGWAVKTVTADYYCWLQSGGPTSVLVQGTLVLGDLAVPSATVNGAVMPSAAIETDGPIVGHVMDIGADAKYGMLMATLDR